MLAADVLVLLHYVGSGALLSFILGVLRYAMLPLIVLSLKSIKEFLVLILALLLVFGELLFGDVVMRIQRDMRKGRLQLFELRI